MGKRSKGKGKCKPNKSAALGEKPEQLNPKLDLGQASSRNIDSSFIIPYTECELEEFIKIKIDELYKTAREWLLSSGYSVAEVESAILNAGQIHGQMDFLNNVVSNSYGFLEKEFKPVGEGFKNMDELHKTTLEAVVDHTIKNHLGMNRLQALWHLLVTRWDDDSSSARTSHPQSSGHDSSSARTSHPKSSGHCENDDDGVTDIFAAAKYLYNSKSDTLFKIGAPVIRGAKTSGDHIKEIRDLQEAAKNQKEWAQRRVIESAERLSEHFSELRKLRMEKKEREKIKNEKVSSELSAKLLEAEQSLTQANSEESLFSDAVKRLGIENDRIRADIAAFKLNASESEMELKQVLKRGKRHKKKLADVEKQNSILLLQCDKEKQSVVQLEQELLQVEKEAKETETEWKQQIMEKMELLTLVDQETKNVKARKTCSRVQLQKLRQKVEKDSLLAKDKCQQLENELTSLREYQSRPMKDLLPKNLDFSYHCDEATHSESSASCEPSPWVCMICMDNEVSVLFLPCTHQVVCFPCYLKNVQAVGVCCLYCGVEIKDAIKVYGRALE